MPSRRPGRHTSTQPKTPQINQRAIPPSPFLTSMTAMVIKHGKTNCKAATYRPQYQIGEATSRERDSARRGTNASTNRPFPHANKQSTRKSANHKTQLAGIKTDCVARTFRADSPSKLPVLISSIERSSLVSVKRGSPVMIFALFEITASLIHAPVANRLKFPGLQIRHCIIQHHRKPVLPKVTRERLESKPSLHFIESTHVGAYVSRYSSRGSSSFIYAASSSDITPPVATTRAI